MRRLPRLGVSLVLGLAMLIGATAQGGARADETVPDAMRPLSTDDNTYVPALGDLMGAIQLRHFKLWYSGKMKNWPLAAYELNQVENSFRDAARLYRHIPLENIVMISAPLEALGAAITARDEARFASAFSTLTTTCNTCHRAAGVGFIQVQIPTASPFSNQVFTPAPR
jgi:cytochrome c553